MIEKDFYLGLPVASNLCIRRLPVQDSCCVCCGSGKTVLHSIIECILSSLVWAELDIVLPPELDVNE